MLGDDASDVLELIRLVAGAIGLREIRLTRLDGLHIGREELRHLVRGEEQEVVGLVRTLPFRAIDLDGEVRISEHPSAADEVAGHRRRGGLRSGSEELLQLAH